MNRRQSNDRRFVLTVAVIVTTCLAFPGAHSVFAVPQEKHQHAASQDVKPPRVFLDKSRRIVDFQLKRLDNQRLLLVERDSRDEKYLPVHEAILKREGVASGDREQALASIVAIKKTDNVSELLATIESLDADAAVDRRVTEQLARLLFAQKPEVLASNASRFTKLAESEDLVTRKLGFGGLLSAGTETSIEKARELAKSSAPVKASLFESLSLVANSSVRNQFHADAIQATQQENALLQLRAVDALRGVTKDPAAAFKATARLYATYGSSGSNDDGKKKVRLEQEAQVRRAAIKTMSSVDRGHRDAELANQTVRLIVERAESLSAEERTEDAVLEELQLADQLLGIIEATAADGFRKRMNEVAVRVILIHTVEEEMRYDVPWFAVEAGRDFQVVLRNEDLMPHNLVFTQPDKLQDVALAGAAIGPTIGTSGKQYVPDSPDVIAATKMVPSDGQARLTIKAPAKAGEYPFVCTFPGHWMRMYGVMIVVEDLASFQRNPSEPKDPIGSNRAFVQSWKPADFAGKLESGMRGRTTAIGEKIFLEATCATCHVVQAKAIARGKAVGPDLTEVFERWKGDTGSVLREILEPSHKIDAKYVVRKVVTLDGVVVSGIVVGEDKDSLSILPNPESLEPTIVAQDDIDEMINSSVSLMPKALLDRFTEDEIFELLAYLKGLKK